MVNEMINIFENANRMFMLKNIELIQSGVSERSLCGALMMHLNEEIRKTKYNDYYVDVEYNRNIGGKLKTIKCSKFEVINITCDIIVHSRGNKKPQDNLIVIEMKKYNRPKAEKEKDKLRLCTLTKDSYDDIWSFDGKTLPDHVCRYVLGVYFEINQNLKSIKIEYYKNGDKFKEYKKEYKN